ncbi:MAG: hypothetical protein PHY34_03530 [Patescibacteria group bacterium]|nr:hypothetical protein [Patescibacteria group bacterium]MDD5715646.1 hypothetical protein [Patescibacteria group bacterium]
MNTRTVATGAGVALAGVFVFALVVGLSLPHGVHALSKHDEVKAAFQEMLDRDPSTVDYTNNMADFKGRAEIKKELNAWPERDLAIQAIYQRALGRAAMERELAQLKAWVADNNRIREQLFNTMERGLAIRNVYNRYLDREPEDTAVDFYEITRSDIGDILDVLNQSSERRLALEQTIEEQIGRDATEDEIEQFLDTRSDLLNVVRGIRNPLIVDVTDSLGNVQENSWAVENTGAWSMEEYQENAPAITAGDEMTFTVRAFDYVPEDVEVDGDESVEEACDTTAIEVQDGKVVNKVFYKFTVGNSMDPIQDWSTSNTVTWTVDAAHLGHEVPITAWVKDNNLIERMGPGLGDDYTYLTYNIHSNSENEDATLSTVTDSLGNTQPDSWIPDGSFGTYKDDNGDTVKPVVGVGDSITLTANATDPEDDSLEYRFMFCNASGNCPVIQDWSTDKTYTWEVTSDDIGYSVEWEIAVKDNNDILAAGDKGDDWTMVTYQVEGTEGSNAVFTKVTDNKGNTRYQSYANDSLNDEDSFNAMPYPILHVGDTVKFTATATDEEGDPLTYKFLTCKTGGSCVIGKDWSTSQTFTWSVTDDYVSPNTVVFVDVKDDNGEDMVGDSGDDWIALTYQVWE